MNDTQRITPWGTVTCGILAVITATLVGLVHLGGVAIPFRTLGPGAIIGLGVLVLAAGLFIVLRSNVRDHKARVTAPVPPVIDRPAEQSVLGQPAEQPSALGQTLATLPTSTLDVTTPQPAHETPAAQGAAEGSSPEERGEAQRNH